MASHGHAMPWMDASSPRGRSKMPEPARYLGSLGCEVGYLSPPPLLYETSVSFSHPPRLHPNTFCRGLGGIHFPFPPSPSGLPLHYQVHRASISCSTAVDSWLALPTPPRTTSLFRIQATIIAREHWMRGSAIAAGAPPPSAIHNYCVEPEPEPYSYQVDQVVAPKRRSQCPKCHAH